MPPPRPQRRAVLTGLAGASILLAAGCAASPEDGAQASDDGPSETGPSIGEDALVTAVGAFAPRSDPLAQGGVRVVRTGGLWVIALEADVRLSPAPDPVVGLGADGFDPAAVLGPLRAESGAQTYALTDGLDIGDYTQVWIWCRARGEPLALAQLTLT